MNSNPGKILIVSYSMPPYGGIGGRRWTKFGIELLRRGYDIQFLTPERKPLKKKRWEEDYKIIKDRIQFFHSDYPEVVQKSQLSLLEKIVYRYWMRKLKRLEKGNYFDPSCLDEQTLSNAVSKLVDKGYKTVISTGAPFVQLYYLSRLKNKKNTFNLIVDLRDPWTMQDWSYGFPSLSEVRKAIERERELYVMKTADRVITVLPRMTKDLSQFADSQKFHTIFNGFDENEITHSSKNDGREESINFIFAGNFYDSALHHIEQLVSSLSKLREESMEVYEKLRFNFYGGAPGEFFELISNEPAIIHHGFIPSSEVGQKIADADIGLLFLIDGFNYSLSTKFFEYIAQSKPIFLFAKPGETSAYISSQGLGWHYNGVDFRNIIEEIISKKERGGCRLPESFDKNQFSIPYLSSQLETQVLNSTPELSHQ